MKTEDWAVGIAALAAIYLISKKGAGVGASGGGSAIGGSAAGGSVAGSLPPEPVDTGVVIPAGRQARPSIERSGAIGTAPTITNIAVSAPDAAPQPGDPDYVTPQYASVYSPGKGLYVAAGSTTDPLAFSAVGSDAEVQALAVTPHLFGDQAGYGGISAGGGSAGASGYRPGGTGTWTPAGYVTHY